MSRDATSHPEWPTVRARRVQVGDELPEIVLMPSPRDLVLFAAGSGDFNEIHYNRGTALAQGLPDAIVHGRLKATYMTTYAVRYVGASGRLARFQVRYRGIDVLGRPMRLGGTVRERQEHLVIDLWIKNTDGTVSTTAVAEFRLIGVSSPD